MPCNVRCDILVCPICFVTDCTKVASRLLVSSLAAGTSGEESRR